MGEAIEAEVAAPREYRRIDRGKDRIKCWDRSGDRYAGGEIDGAPQHRQGQGSDAKQDDEPLLQRRVVAVRGIEADTSGKIEQTFAVIGNPAQQVAPTLLPGLAPFVASTP